MHCLRYHYFQYEKPAAFAPCLLVWQLAQSNQLLSWGSPFLFDSRLRLLELLSKGHNANDALNSFATYLQYICGGGEMTHLSSLVNPSLSVQRIFLRAHSIPSKWFCPQKRGDFGSRSFRNWIPWLQIMKASEWKEESLWSCQDDSLAVMFLRSFKPLFFKNLKRNHK